MIAQAPPPRCAGGGSGCAANGGVAAGCVWAAGDEATCENWSVSSPYLHDTTITHVAGAASRILMQ